jgi:hypothetical protein
VSEANYNTRTASILLSHETEPESVLLYAAEKELFKLVRSFEPTRTLFEHVTDMFRTGNERIKKATGGELDVPSLVFLILLLSGLYQLMRGNLRAPAWYTAFYYAMQIFLTGVASVDDDSRYSGPEVGPHEQGPKADLPE